MCATPGAPVLCLYLDSFHGYPVQISVLLPVPSLHQALSWHSTFLPAPHSTDFSPKSEFEICLARFDLDRVLGSSNRITETTQHQPMRKEGGSTKGDPQRLKIYKQQSESTLPYKIDFLY